MKADPKQGGLPTTPGTDIRSDDKLAAATQSKPQK
jgi:hypothetical protein